MTQRLPIPGSDNGDWGTILNSFLEVSLNADGTLKSSAIGATGPQGSTGSQGSTGATGSTGPAGATGAGASGALLASNNLSDVADAGSSRANLHVPALTPAAAAATTNVSSLSASTTTIDGYSLATGDQVLLTAQSTASQNGVWSVPASGNWTRPAEFSSGAVIKGRTITVMNGTANANTQWILDAPAAGLTIDTTSQTWKEAFSGQYAPIGSVYPASKITTPNGTDDTSAIQAVLNLGGDIVFSPGTYKINALTSLFPISNSRLIFEPGAILQVIPNTADSSYMFNVGGNGTVSNITFQGAGSLVGDLLSRTGSYPSTLTFTATGGTFTLTVSGTTTAAITYSGSLTASTIQTAMTTAGISVTSVTGSNGGPYIITLPGAGAAYVNTSSLTGGTANCYQASQHGQLIYIPAATNVNILGPLNFSYAWGDGIYIGGSSGSAVSGVTIDGPIITDCRRENISPFNGSDIEITRCTITNAGLTAASMGYGVSPSSGIDCEPNAGQTVTDLYIHDNYISGTQGTGIYCSANGGTITGLRISDNRVEGCGVSTNLLTPYQYNGIHVAATNRPRLENNDVSTCAWDNNTNGASGAIYVRSCTGAIVKGGSLYGNLGRGVYVSSSQLASIRGLNIQLNAAQAVTIYSSPNSVLAECEIWNNNGNSSFSAKPHVEWQSVNLGEIARNNFYNAAAKGSYLVSIETSGSDNVVRDNTAFGALPNSGTYNDSGTTTLVFNNITKSTGGDSFWTPNSTYVGAGLTVEANQFADLLGWAYDPATIISGTILSAAATEYLIRIPLSETISVTNVLVDVTSLGATLTNSFVTLRTSAGTLVGQSADQSSAWETGGTAGSMTIALASGPFTVSPLGANDFVTVGIYVGTAGTLPTFGRGVTSNSVFLNLGQATGRYRFGSIAIANTSTLPNITPSSVGKASNSYWAAIA